MASCSKFFCDLLSAKQCSALNFSPYVVDVACTAVSVGRVLYEKQFCRDQILL